MKEDRDLQFLAYCNSNDLKTLVDLMTYDKNGDIRLTEQLTNTDAYLRYYPDQLNCMWQEIANELQRFGGNTLANLWRRGGVCYREILKDVCRKMEVYFRGEESTEDLEKALLEKVCLEAIDKMPEEELREMAEQLGIGGKKPRKYAMVFALQLAVKKGGPVFIRIVAYVTSMISRMLLGRSLFMVGGNLLNKVLGVLGGPVGWAITLGWTAVDLASPAYRVTIPCVIQVACMRMNQNYGYNQGRIAV